LLLGKKRGWRWVVKFIDKKDGDYDVDYESPEYFIPKRAAEHFSDEEIVQVLRAVRVTMVRKLKTSDICFISEGVNPRPEKG
jgi:hypothetical protein